MAFGTLELTLRPLKLAFLVDPADHAALTEAIQINTFLWGGMFNPIIPVFRRLPAVWRERFHSHLTSQTLVTGYLDAFDPDFVVTVGKVTPPKTGVGFREVIPSSEILSEVEADGTPKYGVGLIEVLNHFAGKELTFVRHHPLSLRLPEWDGDYALFFAATFGALPDQLADWFRKHYAKLPGIEWKPCSLETFTEFLDAENFFLRRLGHLHIRRHLRNSFPLCDYIFFMDASRVVDIIDYWNLRAAGWNVFPTPKQAVTNEKLQDMVRGFMVEHHYSLQGNPSIFNAATLLKSRCTSEAEIRAFCELLRGRTAENQDLPEFTVQTWQPPIWDEWAREHNNAQCAELESDQVSHEMPEPQSAQSFKTLFPSFASRFGGHSKARFANKIELRVYGGDEPFAEAIPETESKLELAFQFIGHREIRFSKRGPVHLAHHVDWPIRFAVPKAEDFFKAWLNTQGWNAELSDKGHIARQMLKQISGVWGLKHWPMKASFLCWTSYPRRGR